LELAVRYVCLAALVFVLTVVGASCGGDQTEEDRVVAAVEQLQEDMAAGKLRDVCGALTGRVQRQIGSVGHGREPTVCWRDLEEFENQDRQTAAVEEIEGLRRGPKPDVLEVRIARDGRSAVAKASFGDDSPFPIRLKRERDDWKLDDFFGAQAPAPKELR
jgi:hypothetical protein